MEIVIKIANDFLEIFRENPNLFVFVAICLVVFLLYRATRNKFLKIRSQQEIKELRSLLEKQNEILNNIPLDQKNGQDYGEGSLEKNAEGKVVFVSYSSNDEQYFNELKLYLSPVLQRYDFSLLGGVNRINTDENWKERIEKEITRASVAIVLVSPDYLASNFLMKYELPNIDKAATNSGLNVLFGPSSPLSYRVHRVNQI